MPDKNERRAYEGCSTSTWPNLIHARQDARYPRCENDVDSRIHAHASLEVAVSFDIGY